MATVNEKMTTLADEIRKLSGTTETMGLDAMATNVSTANTEISSQADLLAQAISALENKAAGSGGSVETCTVTITNPYASNSYVEWYFANLLEDGEVVYKGVTLYDQYEERNTYTRTIENVVCGSIFFLSPYTTYGDIAAVHSGAETLYSSSDPAGNFFKITAPAGGNVEIHLYNDD